ncbi:hypothetical protein M9H77_26912 [Catharanthus roseus]|uniref:Uncharacterized protein n=1 Tax=Catharanthus roseus TaxID=4058 RepID=A0ACC0ABE2_CATRO|nr:hypothetical protein M9H77_26912 [Catharanthus roseus]
MGKSFWLGWWYTMSTDGHLPTQSHQEGTSDTTRMNLNETLQYYGENPNVGQAYYGGYHGGQQGDKALEEIKWNVPNTFGLGATNGDCIHVITELLGCALANDEKCKANDEKSKATCKNLGRIEGSHERKIYTGA